MTQEMFQDWLEARHAGLATSPDVVASYVQKAVGSEPEAVARIIKGTDHEVYDIATTDGQGIIVRIAHHQDHRLEAERWALDAARAKGVPAPKVLLLEETEHEGKSLMFCIEEKLPGEPLNDLIDQGKDVSSVIPQVGEMLGKIHSVHTEGFGYLQPDGKGWPVTWREIMLDLNAKKEDLLDTAKKESFPEQKILTGLEVLNAHKDMFEYDRPVLNHGDFLPEHILVEEGQISGIIDMQQCSGNHPIMDFTSWQADNLEVAPTSLVYERYPHKDVFKGEFDLLLHLATLRHLMWMLMVHSGNQEKRGVAITKSGLENSLIFFEA